jgi:hypothetical protein
MLEELLRQASGQATVESTLQDQGAKLGASSTDSQVPGDDANRSLPHGEAGQSTTILHDGSPEGRSRISDYEKGVSAGYTAGVRSERQEKRMSQIIDDSVQDMLGYAVAGMNRGQITTDFCIYDMVHCERKLKFGNEAAWTGDSHL